jgi:phosphatidate cytidylyltransferase
VTRIVSAVVLIAVVVGVTWWLPWWAMLPVLALVAGLAARELAMLATTTGAHAPQTFIGVAAAVVATAVALEPFLLHPPPGGLLAVVAAAALVSGGALTLLGGPPSPAAITRAAITIMAPIYVGLPLGVLGWTRAAVGPGALTWFLVVIAASDTAQLYSGRLFGRRKLAPVVSPGKTVEGAIGGFAGAVIAGAALGPAWMPGDPIWVPALLALILAAAGIVGDLFESMLKRSAGVKDVSSIIPGHGGVLDRVDSYLLAAPLFYLYLVSRLG